MIVIQANVGTGGQRKVEDYFTKEYRTLEIWTKIDCTGKLSNQVMCSVSKEVALIEQDLSTSCFPYGLFVSFRYVQLYWLCSLVILNLWSFLKIWVKWMIIILKLMHSFPSMGSQGILLILLSDDSQTTVGIGLGWCLSFFLIILLRFLQTHRNNKIERKL